MRGKARTVNLIEGSIWKGLILFSLPLMASNLFQQFYNTMDSLVVGQFVGSTALAAVGSTGSLSFLVIGFFMGFGTGSGVIIAQHYGAKEPEEVSKSVHTAMALAIFFGIVLGVVGILIAPGLLKLMNTPDDVMDQAVLYLRIYFGGVITLTVYNIGSGIMRAVGDSKRPLYYLVISGITNVVLNLVFVIVFHLGVAGVALATIASQLLSSVLVVRDLMRTQESYRLELRKIRFHKEILLKIAKIGIPAGVQSMVISLSNIVIQSKINIFGSDAMAGQAAAQRIDGFVYMPLNAFSLAMTTFTAQNLGAGKFDRVHRGTKTAMLLGLISTIALGWSAALLARPLVGLFTDKEEVLYYGIRSVLVLGGTYFTFVFNDILAGVIRGAGNAVVPMTISIFNMCIVRILWLTIILSIWKNYYLVLVCYPMTWTLSSLCYIIYYFKGKWREPWKQKEAELMAAAAEKEA
ncbi:MAG: MATE family efflux transporter [Lachnospiraceae bacterium]|jgi:putative MATE family efflux protein|nr:MATE family efflux transporter [Lachnospiraceae bacterium]